MNSVDEFITRFRADGWASKPTERIIDFIDRDRSSLLPLALRILGEFPEGGTYFDDLLSHLSEDDFSALMENAITRWCEGAGSEATDSVFAHASLQFPKLLASHLSNFFDRPPNEDTYYVHFPWRGADEAEIHRLIKIVEIEQQGSPLFERALDCLLETRNIETLRLLLRTHGKKLGTGTRDFSALLQNVDHHVTGGNVQRLYSSQCFHMVFPADYPSLSEGPVEELRKRHPTRHCRAVVRYTATIGGVVEANCSLCRGLLHQLLRLPVVPNELPVSQGSVSFATCLSCLGWEKAPLYYEHDADGRMKCINNGFGTTRPEFVQGPLLMATVDLNPTDDRWFYQDVGLSNSRQNLNRVGGPPTWIQDASYNKCCRCSRKMDFVAQLDSHLADNSGSEWLWGSGGICYLFWCDECKTSAAEWQCT